MILLILVIGSALIFDYVNGFHDTANAIATSVSTRALSVRSAIILAATLNFAGAMVSTKVATTIGKGIVDPVNITQMVVLAGIGGAIIWDVITWYLGLPTSSSHALIGGYAGAAILKAGFQVIIVEGWIKTLIFIVVAPFLGWLGAVATFVSIVTIQGALSFWTVEGLEIMNALSYGGRQVASYPMTAYRGFLRHLFLSGAAPDGGPEAGTRSRSHASAFRTQRVR